MEKSADKAEKVANSSEKIAEAVDPNNIGDTVKKAKDTVVETKDKAIDTVKKAPEKIKETAKKAKETAQKVPEKTKELAKTAKKNIKNAPKKAKDLALKGKNQVSEAAKKTRKAIDNIRKNPAEAAKKVGNLAKNRGKNFLHRHNPVTRAKRKIENVKRGIRNTRRFIRAARRAARNAARLMRNIGRLIAQVGSKIITFLVSNPIGWAIDIALVMILLIVLIFNFSDDEENPSLGGEGMGGANGSSWIQFTSFVLKNEGGSKDPTGQYYIVEDDSWRNPTIGHGLCLYSSGYLHVEAFAKHGIDSKKLADDWLRDGTQGKVSVDICDAIWEENLKSLYDSVKNTYAHLNLKEYQIYALVDVKYRRGNTDGFETAYNQYWTSSDDQYGKDTSSESYSMSSLYSFFNNGFSDTTSGVYTRKKRQWLLFKYGYYESLGEYYQESNYGTSYDSSFYGGINIYNDDGSVNSDKMNQLDEHLTIDYLNTVHHFRNSLQQWGPFAKWWSNNGLAKFQCTWWANGRASQYLEFNGSKYKKYPTTYGNGGDYYSINKNNGYFNYGTTPKRNSIISWNFGAYGHVAYVEAVDAITGDIWISHAGGGWSWFGVQKCTKTSNYTPWSGYGLNGFVYLDEPK